MKAKRKPARLRRVLILPDAHIPYHSTVWLDLVLQVGKSFKPDIIAIMGDWGEFYGVSSHAKDAKKANRMDEEIEACNAALDLIDALGATDKLYIEGNHEDRLRRYLMDNPALHNVVSTEKLLRLKERGWKFTSYKDHAKRGAAYFTHDVGSAGRNAIYKALGLYQKTIITAHTHRMQMVVEGSVTGEPTLAASFGWGGDVEQIDYMNRATARRDWALGMGVGYLDPSSGIVYLTPIPVVRKTVCVEGRVFRAA